MHGQHNIKHYTKMHGQHNIKNSFNRSHRSNRGYTILCINVQSSGLLQIIRFDLQAKLLLKLFTVSSGLINHTRNQDTSCQCVCSRSQRCHSYVLTNIYWLYFYLSDFRTSLSLKKKPPKPRDDKLWNVVEWTKF